MKTVTIPVFVYFQKHSFDEFGSYFVYSVKLEDSESRTFVCQQDVDFNVHERYDQTEQKILALELERAKITEEFSESVLIINNEINSLLAFGFKP